MDIEGGTGDGCKEGSKSLDLGIGVRFGFTQGGLLPEKLQLELHLAQFLPITA